jgi:hypothetical protein
VVPLGHQLRTDPAGTSPTLARLCEILGFFELSVALVAASLPSVRSKLRRMDEAKARKQPKRKDGQRTIGGSGIVDGSNGD